MNTLLCLVSDLMSPAETEAETSLLSGTGVFQFNLNRTPGLPTNLFGTFNKKTNPITVNLPTMIMQATHASYTIPADKEIDALIKYAEEEKYADKVNSPPQLTQAREQLMQTDKGTTELIEATILMAVSKSPTLNRSQSPTMHFNTFNRTKSTTYTTASHSNDWNPISANTPDSQQSMHLAYMIPTQNLSHMKQNKSRTSPMHSTTCETPKEIIYSRITTQIQQVSTTYYQPTTLIE